ncbi:hypothetical protein D5S17_35570 [Pseudonocardiaceae bacterium YIM PH 21723]|nr:hypothetical protein D5S17_35570 [Pseudonocardiaceae bacterium YIM PH 21723]
MITRARQSETPDTLVPADHRAPVRNLVAELSRELLLSLDLDYRLSITEYGQAVMDGADVAMPYSRGMFYREWQRLTAELEVIGQDLKMWSGEDTWALSPTAGRAAAHRAALSTLDATMTRMRTFRELLAAEQISDPTSPTRGVPVNGDLRSQAASTERGGRSE